MKDVSVLLIEDNKDDEWLALRALKKIGLTNVSQIVGEGIAGMQYQH